MSAFLELSTDGSDGFLQRILKLRGTLGIPHQLTELTMTDAHVEAFAAEAVKDPAGFGNPVELDTAAYADLYRHCLSGELPTGLA